MTLSVRLQTLSMFPATATAQSKMRSVLLLMDPLLRAEVTSSTGCGYRLAVGLMSGGCSQHRCSRHALMFGLRPEPGKLLFDKYETLVVFSGNPNKSPAYAAIGARGRVLLSQQDV
jgi:hypothetical protein